SMRISALRTYSPVAVLSTRPRTKPACCDCALGSTCCACSCGDADSARTTAQASAERIGWFMGGFRLRLEGAGDVAATGGAGSGRGRVRRRERCVVVAGPAHQVQARGMLVAFAQVRGQVEQAIAERLQADIGLLVPAAHA